MIVNLLTEKHTGVSYDKSLLDVPKTEGNPPWAGWWNASIYIDRSFACWRYWNGLKWSQYVIWDGYEDDWPPQTVLERAKALSHSEQLVIEWRAVQPPWGDS